MDNQLTKNIFDINFVSSQITRAIKADELIDKEIQIQQGKLDLLIDRKRKLKQSIKQAEAFGEVLKFI